MDRFKSIIEVSASSDQCYGQWRDFENFPTFMKNVKSVTSQGERRYHWVVNGPLGVELEWDAQMDADEAGQVISWHTISEPDVGVQGAVRFDEIAPNRTQVTCTIQYEAPAGGLGDMVAGIFSNPQKMVDEDLQNFKELVESGQGSQATARVGAGTQTAETFGQESGYSGTGLGSSAQAGSAAAYGGQTGYAEPGPKTPYPSERAEEKSTGYGPASIDNELDDQTGGSRDPMGKPNA